MFYNLKIAIRSLKTNGTYSAINIVGLAVSLAVAILILLWVNDELSFDKFHPREKDIYQTVVSVNMDGKDLYWKSSSHLLGVYSKEEIPEIEQYCRVQFGFEGSLTYQEKQSGTVRSIMVDSTFFSMFNFPLWEGDVMKPFTDRHSVIISRKIASVLFGEEEAMGKIVYADGKREFHVTGIMENMPGNTAFRSDIIFSYDLMHEYKDEQQLNHWGNLGVCTFFILKPDANTQSVTQHITDIQQKNMPDFKMTYLLQPLSKNHFYEADGKTNANMQACRLFTIAVFVILIIACINYVNLVTARFARRNKELFVKKILGARKPALFMKSMLESTVLFLAALVLATLILVLIFPFFKEISGKDAGLNLFSAETLAIYGLTFVIVTIFAGIFPALNLSLNNPLQAVQGTRNPKSGGLFFRRLLVVLQFISATVLILGAIVLTKQMQYIQKKDLGYNKENVLCVHLSRSSAPHYESIKTDLQQQSGVLGVTSASQEITSVYNASGWKNHKDKSMMMIVFLDVDKDFIPTMGMQLIEGKNFTGTPADSSHFILNETAIRNTGITDPIGKTFEFQKIEGTIIGVTKDFNFQNLHAPVEPLVLSMLVPPTVMYIRIAPQSATQVIAALETIWKRNIPETPFEYNFLDDNFDKIYKSDVRINQLFNWFAIIAILVSCLGLFGLVTYTAETKTKEIGIRKVLGASVSNIVNMLSKEFLILVVLAMLIAFPFAYYWLDKMLQDYAYRISIGWWMFALAALITVVLTIITVGFQAIKAATANPVKSIKTE